MLIPRFWARVTSHATAPDGRSIPFHTWRGSRESQAAAEALAAEAAERIAARIARGEGFPEKYTYGNRPLREEVVRELPGAGNDPDVAVTRNSYGALVLNAARVFFIDVDVPAEGSAEPPRAGGSDPAAALLDSPIGKAVTDALPPSVRSLVQGLFGRGAATPEPTPAPARPASPTDAALDQLRTWLRSRPDWNVRVYRTSAGLRYVVTHATFSATDPETVSIMEALGADPQYIRLCRAQKSFRARLTPKPWRLHMENPPARFPYESASDEAAVRDWIRRYDEASRRYSTCRLMEVIGSGAEHPDVAPVVAMHDEHTGADSDRPLA